MVAGAIVVPQLIVTLLSPWVGRTAQRLGRRPLLLLGFGALVVRSFLFTAITEPHLLVLVQVLDGVSAATIGVLTPLTIVDLTREHGHFNLAQGAVGCAVGVGAAISTTLAGYVSDRFDSPTAFLIMAGFGLLGLAAAGLAMPETRPRADESAGD